MTHRVHMYPGYTKKMIGSHVINGQKSCPRITLRSRGKNYPSNALTGLTRALTRRPRDGVGGATRASSELCATPARRSPRATARADGPRCTAPSTTGTRAPPPRSSRAARASTPRSTCWADPRWTSSPERSADVSTTTPSTVRGRIDRPRHQPAPPQPPPPRRRRRRRPCRAICTRGAAASTFSSARAR